MTNILYVDDEAEIREIATLSLSLDPTFHVRSCATGEEALQVVADWIPDLIMLDVVMPEMDGPTTLAHLRETSNGGEAPVIFLTARAGPDDVERLLSLGAIGVIAKPFNPRTLALTVKSYLQDT